MTGEEIHHRDTEGTEKKQREVERRPAARLGVWERLMSPACDRLRGLAAEADPYDAAAVGRLRREFDAELVQAALQLARAREKARGKFGERAERLVADPQGVEMASSSVAAGHKAKRFVEVLGRGPIVDLCCGVGGDAMGLVGAGLEVTAVDLDPVRAWMAGVNAGCRSVCADAADAGLPDGPFHIDPARRTEDNTRRLVRWEDLRPGPEVLRAIIDRRGTGAIKLGPGVDVASLPPGEVEVVSERGRLTQAVLWLAALSRGDGVRTATLLPAGVGLSGNTQDADPPSGPLDPYVFEVDDAVERAGLLGTLCREVGLPMVHPRLGLLTGDGRVESPWLTAFEVIEEMPWNEKRAAERLRALGAGVVEVKTRGRAVDPDALQKRLSGEEGPTLTLFVLRFDRALRAIIARRVGPRGAGP